MVPVAIVVAVLAHGGLVHGSRAEQAAHQRERRVVVCNILGCDVVGVGVFAIMFVGVHVRPTVVCMDMSVIIVFVPAAAVLVTVVVVVCQCVVTDREVRPPMLVGR